MSAASPETWAREKRAKLRACAQGPVGRWSREALAVCLPGVPLAAALGFAANGDGYNTTGWRAGDEAERAEALRRGRKPFGGNPSEGYGAIGSHDLHELGWYGVEGGYEGTPVAADPSCPWVTLATDDDVRKILGRPAVTGARWFGAIADQCAVGIANLKRHMRQVREHLDPRLAWDDAKPTTLWMWSMACMSWSAGTRRAAQHVNRYVDALAPLTEAARVGAFMRLAARLDDPGPRHRQDEYSALREAQKRAAGRLAATLTGEGDDALRWLDDGLGDDRAVVHARLVATAAG